MTENENQALHVRHDRRQWCCPYEVWDGRTFVAAYQTLREALGRIAA